MALPLIARSLTPGYPLFAGNVDPSAAKDRFKVVG
jgi:hypothetical protein